MLTVEADGRADEKDDGVLLDRAGELGRAMFSIDDDFLEECARRDRAGEPYVPVFYAHQLQSTVGQIVTELVLFCTLGELDDPDLASQVTRLPTRRPEYV